MDRFRLLSALALVLAVNAEARAEKFLVVFERLEHRDNAKGGDSKSIVRARQGPAVRCHRTSARASRRLNPSSDAGRTPGWRRRHARSLLPG